MSPDDFFATLLEHKGILDNCPFLVSGDEDGLEKAYCLLHASTQDLPKAKQTRHIHKRVQGYFKAIHDISKTLFVLVAASVSTRNLASLHEDEIFPSIEQWWQCHPPSERFEAHSLSLLCKLEERRRKGELVHRKSLFPRFLEDRLSWNKVPGGAGRSRCPGEAKTVGLNSHCLLWSHQRAQQINPSGSTTQTLA